jgi:hypothetical protein
MMIRTVVREQREELGCDLQPSAFLNGREVDPGSIEVLQAGDSLTIDP